VRVRRLGLPRYYEGYPATILGLQTACLMDCLRVREHLFGKARKFFKKLSGFFFFISRQRLVHALVHEYVQADLRRLFLDSHSDVVAILQDHS